VALLATLFLDVCSALAVVRREHGLYAFVALVAELVADATSKRIAVYVSSHHCDESEVLREGLFLAALAEAFWGLLGRFLNLDSHCSFNPPGQQDAEGSRVGLIRSGAIV
jgi:hypothetical protein